MRYPIPAAQGASVSFTSLTVDEHAVKPFSDTIDVKVTPTTQPLAAVVGGHVSTAGRWVPGFRVVSDRPTWLSNRLPAHLFELAFELPNLGPLRAFQLVTVHAGKSYLVTLTAAPGTFERSRSQFEKCVTSLSPS